MDVINVEQTCHMCVTRTHEFLVHDSICVAVRDRRSGDWLDDHFAVDERVSLVPRPRTQTLPGTRARWDLQIFTFGNRVRVGPLEEVAGVSAELRATVQEHVARRYGGEAREQVAQSLLHNPA